MMKLFLFSTLFLGFQACKSGQKKDSASSEVKSEIKESDKKAATGVSSAKISCTLDKETRTLEVKEGAQGGCETHYNKGGEDQIVGSAKYDNSYCEKIFEKIKGKLEGSGYTCK